MFQDHRCLMFQVLMSPLAENLLLLFVILLRCLWHLSSHFVIQDPLLDFVYWLFDYNLYVFVLEPDHQILILLF